MKKIGLQGTITAIITPFLAEGDVDFEALKKIIDFQIEKGIDGLVVCGSTGESATLTLKEKVAVIQKAVEFSAGRVPIIAGTGSNETEGTLNLSVIAKEQGADALLLVTPYYNKPTQDGLFEHFRLVAENVDIPVILYNVPGRTATNVLPETQLRLAEACPNIVATKEASGNLEQMMEIIRNAPAHFHLLSGDDALALPITAIGGKGVVSVISNYAPDLFGDLIRLAMKGDFKKALKIQYRLYELMKLNFVESNPIPVKYAMSLLGLCNPVYRLPLLEMTAPNQGKMKAAMKDAKLID